MKGKKHPDMIAYCVFPHVSTWLMMQFSKYLNWFVGKNVWKYLLHIPWQLDEKYLKISQCLSIKPQPQFQGIHGIQPRPQPCNHKKRKKIKTLNVFVVHFQSRVILEWDHFSG